jgi:hypothetical protein
MMAHKEATLLETPVQRSVRRRSDVIKKRMHACLPTPARWIDESFVF